MPSTGSSLAVKKRPSSLRRVPLLRQGKHKQFSAQTSVTRPGFTLPHLPVNTETKAGGKEPVWGWWNGRTLGTNETTLEKRKSLPCAVITATPPLCFETLCPGLLPPLLAADVGVMLGTKSGGDHCSPAFLLMTRGVGIGFHPVVSYKLIISRIELNNIQNCLLGMYRVRKDLIVFV